MTTDFRALCAELVATLAERIDDKGDAGPYFAHAALLLNRARVALAEPEPEEPTDEELSDLWSWAAGQDQGPWPTQQHCFARAVLARWGNPAPQPLADGEVAELVLRVQRLEAMRETEKAALLDAFKQIDDLKHRIDFHYMKIHRLEDALPLPEVDQMTWQSIDTAPRDGTEILASDYDAIEIVSWVGPRFDVKIIGEWTNREGEAMYPAWWQPLPDHPSLPGQEVEA